MKNLKAVVQTYITGGLNPAKASQAVGIGLLWGIFPLVGTSTALCTMSALLLRLNVALVIAINYLLYPLQILLIIPFVMMGQSITGSSYGNLISGDDGLSRIFTISNFHELSGEFFSLILDALAGWVLTAPGIALVAYLIVRHILERRDWQTRYQQENPLPDQ